jgi:cytochrome c
MTRHCVRESMTIDLRSSIVIACALLAACGGSGSTDKTAANDTPGSGAAVATASPAVAAATPPPAFAICSSCHAVQPGRQGVGPSLAGVVGRKAASLPGYAYSDALKASGIVWDAKTLDTWLAGPMKMVPGTKMVIALPDPNGRKAVIEYLQTLK